MISNLYGNPHSASLASQLSARCIEDIRLKLLRLFNADPEDFDIVFVANATAGIKLVMDAFRDYQDGFWYGYHRDSHTSLVGVREAAKEHRCFATDAEVEAWIGDLATVDVAIARPALVAYPAQSSMNGRRLPLDWCRDIREATSTSRKPIFTLLDAAALVSTSALRLNDMDSAPDFIVLSLYKIFGFPDLGALIVRKASSHIFQHRNYFGGGTVDMVVCLKEQWHARKSETIHDQLEDGTLPIHSIMAVSPAIDVHRELFGSLDKISRHASFLARRLYDGLLALRHKNDLALCEIYKDPSSTYDDTKSQGPIVAFNLRNSRGAWISNAEVEKLASIRNIQLRTGGLCNPGGMASSLRLAPWEMRENFSAGQRCGTENDITGGKPTGMIRVSLGAMSTLRDVNTFLHFLHEFFVDSDAAATPITPDSQVVLHEPAPFYVESLTVYPIKSCAGWKVPSEVAWAVRKEGLAWDREWCLVHQGTGVALSQKRHPRMALIRPTIDFGEGVMRVRYAGGSEGCSEVVVPLSNNPFLYLGSAGVRSSFTKVCGDTVVTQMYKSEKLAEFFTRALGVACQLARFPAAGASPLLRHSKAHLQHYQERPHLHIPGSFPAAVSLAGVERPILLSNESPILTISRSSLNRLNEQIKINGGKAAQAEVFRANIVVAEDLGSAPGAEQPYAEDDWRYLQIGQQCFQMLGSCRRCQMVCIDQDTAVKNEEPFVTLAKTRRFDGKVFFGQHTCHSRSVDGMRQGTPLAQNPTIMVGDPVRPYEEGEQ